MTPDTYRLFGILLMLSAGVDYFFLRSLWHAHLFYVGFLLFLSGSIMAHLVSIKAAADSVQEGMQSRQEHLVNIRSLLDSVDGNMRTGQFVEHLIAVRTLLDAILIETRKR